jgi:hypothetical protein
LNGGKHDPALLERMRDETQSALVLAGAKFRR